MVSDTTERRLDAIADLRRAQAGAAGPDPLEDSQIMLLFDGICGMRSIEVTRECRCEGPGEHAPLRAVIREREIGHVSEPMC